MHRFRDIRAAEIDDNSFALAAFRRAEPFILCHRRPCVPANASSVTSRLMKPGPAISTFEKIESVLRRAAIFSAIARGFCLAAFRPRAARHCIGTAQGRADRRHEPHPSSMTGLRPRTRRPRSPSAPQPAKSRRVRPDRSVVVELRLDEAASPREAGSPKSCFALGRSMTTDAILSLNVVVACPGSNWKSTSELLTQQRFCRRIHSR